MALRKRETDKHIPGASTKPAKCRYERDGKKCGHPAHNWVAGTIEVMGKDVSVKLPICDTCLKEVGGNASYSTK